jgi:hypothetical protein
MSRTPAAQIARMRKERMYTHKYAALLAAGIIFTACSPKQQVQANAAAPLTGQAASSSSATVFGRITDNDWYMVATSTPGVKPLVIWVPSHSDCEKSAGEFNLKSVDPKRQGEPAKAWCAQGREIRAKLKI